MTETIPEPTKPVPTKPMRRSKTLLGAVVAALGSLGVLATAIGPMLTDPEVQSEITGRGTEIADAWSTGDWGALIGAVIGLLGAAYAFYGRIVAKTRLT